ncbi:MAG TPA: hypothetical protein VKG23_12020 [Thermoanaerobaculia bacterium]|nr:hypothetical protein [Thermoanaerobaculia bacterium]
MRNRLLAVAVLLACAFALRAEDKFYQVNLVPSGSVIAKDLPVTRGTMVVFHQYPSGNLVSMPRASLKSVFQIPAESAKTVNIAERAVPIGNLAMQGGSSQAGATNMRVIGQAKAAANANAKENQIGGPGFYSNVIPGQTEAMPNSANDFQVGRTYAFAPSNATQTSPGAPPTAPAMTSGQNPPQ